VKNPAPPETIERTVVIVRRQRVILDSDLAALYGVETRRLNEQVRRNGERFPHDFMFQLTREELAHLKSQFATSSAGWGGKRKMPTVFTEHGALMAASVLNSSRAVQMSVYVVRRSSDGASPPGGPPRGSMIRQLRHVARRTSQYAVTQPESDSQFHITEPAP
jgi:hypothetical protein